MRKDEDKTKAELIQELANIRRRVTDLAASGEKRKVGEEELWRGDEMRSTVFNATPDLIGIIDKNWVILDVNKAMAKRFGKHQEELIGSNGRNLISPELARSRNKHFEEVFRTGKPCRFEDERRGMYFENLVYPVLQEQGEIKRIAIHAIDVTERKRVEEALQRSEDEYRTLVEKSPVGIYYSDFKGTFLYGNKEAERIVGYNREELIGKNYLKLKLLEPKEIGKAIKLLALNKLGRETGPDEFTLHRKDGSESIVEIRTRLIDIGDKKAVLGMVTDITERKKTEQALRKNEELFRIASELASDVVYERDMRTGIATFYGDIDSHLGYEPRTMEEWRKHVHPEDLAWIDKQNIDQIEPGTPYSIEYRMRKKDGTYMIWSDRVMMIRDEETGKPLKIIGAATDITERKQAEQALQESRDWMAAIRKSIPDLIMVLDEDGRYVDVLSGEEELLYVQKEKIIGQRLHDLLPKDIADVGLATIRLALNTGNTQMMEYRLAVPAGERWFEGKISPVTSTEGRGKLVVMVARDIAERKRREEDEQKIERLESLGTLAGGIAHDFNNLLTGIIGNISLVKRHKETSGKTVERLDEVEKASLRAKDLTQQLLTFARGGTPVKELTNITKLIKESATFALRGSNVKLELSMPDDIWSVEIDEGQVNQVILNIVKNADEAMPAGGKLYVSVSNMLIKRRGNIPLPKGNYLRIDIKDEGIGMSEKQLERIFEPYYTTKQKGSGLGLSTAYSIVKNHNGCITIESKQNVGTTFRVYLPASEKAAPQKEEVNEGMRIAGKRKILVMDDEEIIRDMLSEMLTLLGCQVALTGDGTEAIAKYTDAKKSGKPFNAVIMDLTVPGGMGGKEAIEKLLQIDPDVKVIVSSGYATDPIMSEYKEYGFSAVITKPYSVTELEKTLHSLLGEKR